MKNKICLTCILTIFYSCIFAQCDDFVYNRQASPQINNYPDFNLQNDLEKIIKHDSFLTIIIDTSRLASKKLDEYIIEQKSTQFEERYKFFCKEGESKDNEPECSYYLIDKLHDSTYFVTSSRNNFFYSTHAYYLNKSFVLFYASKKGWTISVFNYHTLTATNYYYNFIDGIGYNDSVVYIQTPFDIKINKKKYKKGCIFALNENGLQFFKCSPEDERSFPKERQLFFSDKFTVSRKFIEKRQVNCETEENYMVYIKNETQIIDSFIHNFGYAIVSPSIDYSAGKLLVYNSNFFKLYDSNKLQFEWKSSSWVEKFEILKNSYPHFLYKDQVLLLALNCRENEPFGLTATRQFTLNNIPFNQNATDYKLVMAFNLATNKFIGYPNIVFSNQYK